MPGFNSVISHGWNPSSFLKKAVSGSFAAATCSGAFPKPDKRWWQDQTSMWSATMTFGNGHLLSWLFDPSDRQGSQENTFQQM